jgi:hypothetical protein
VRILQRAADLIALATHIENWSQIVATTFD